MDVGNRPNGWIAYSVKRNAPIEAKSRTQVSGPHISPRQQLILTGITIFINDK